MYTVKIIITKLTLILIPKSQKRSTLENDDLIQEIGYNQRPRRPHRTLPSHMHFCASSSGVVTIQSVVIKKCLVVLYYICLHIYLKII